MLGRWDIWGRADERETVLRAAREGDRGGPLVLAVYRRLIALIHPLELFCIRRDIGPTAITLASLGAAILAALLAASGFLFAAGAIYLVAGGFDLLDGRIARLTHRTSPQGAALDSIVDRLAEALVLGGVAWCVRGTPGAPFAVVFLVASMAVSYARARGEGLGVSVGQGAMARGPRVVMSSLLMCGEGLFGSAGKGHPSLLFIVGIALLAVLTTMTAARRVVLVLAALPGPLGIGPDKEHARRSVFRK
jgi:CDP-diacylglycerol--glycerol-3-phosphate 3-phosphatidyltransferase